MNLFILDEDFDQNAEFHIDKHIGKMQLEATQLLTATLWVDKYIGFAPRALTSEELGVINEAKSKEPDIEDRKFTRYLPTHINHPCAIWVRSDLHNYWWTYNYINALDSENVWRGNKTHASCAEANRLPEPIHVTCAALTPFVLAMPDEYKSEDAVQSYRTYYQKDKAAIASWKRRGQPHWWYDPYKAYEATVDKNRRELLGTL